MSESFQNFLLSPRAPNCFRLRADGTLFCVDGTAPQARLRELFAQVAKPCEQEIPVCVMHRDGYALLASDAYLGHNMSA